jgi:hypothetical protein
MNAATQELCMPDVIVCNQPPIPSDHDSGLMPNIVRATSGQGWSLEVVKGTQNISSYRQTVQFNASRLYTLFFRLNLFRTPWKPIALGARQTKFISIC